MLPNLDSESSILLSKSFAFIDLRRTSHCQWIVQFIETHFPRHARSTPFSRCSGRHSSTRDSFFEPLVSMLTPLCGESIALNSHKPVVMTFKLPKIESPVGELRTLTLVALVWQDEFERSIMKRKAVSRISRAKRAVTRQLSSMFICL